MTTDDELRGLAPWQRGVFAAGCALRVSALVDAFGTDRERRAFRRALSAVFDGRGRLADATVGRLRAELRAAQRDMVALVPPRVLGDAFGTLNKALRACGTDTEASLQGARYASYGSSELFEQLKTDPSTWVGIEQDAQRRTLALVMALPPDEAVAAVATFVPDGDMAALVAQVARDDQLPLSGPLPPEPAARVRHAGHDPHPAAADQPSVVLVSAGDAVVADTPPWRSGDVMRLSLEPGDSTVLDNYEGVLAVGSSWTAPYLDEPLPVEVSSGVYDVTPDPATLDTDDDCRLGIGGRTVYAVRAFVMSPRRQPGTRAVLVARAAGTAPLGGYGRYFEYIQPYGYPIEVVLVHRPYAFLERGDRVVDADGAGYLFRPPFLFLTAEAEASLPSLVDWPLSSVPRWPLSLRERDGRAPTTVEGEAVATATGSGCHDGELDAWERHAGVSLPAEADLLPWFLDPGPGQPTYRPM